VARTNELSDSSAGVEEKLVRSGCNLQWQDSKITKRHRSQLKGQKPCCVWLTGLSGAGKTTLANLLDEDLFKAGRHTYVLDGDRCRDSICSDLDFTPQGRTENVRRIAQSAKLMVDAGLIVIVSLISPFAAQRKNARSLFAPDEFLEIFLDTPLSTCESRDAKGLYRKARQGLVADFTGITSLYERPQDPDLILDGREQPLKLLSKLLEALNEKCMGLTFNG
jgi:adenylyl-sulfate kinase